MTLTDLLLDDYVSDFFLDLLNPLNRINAPSLRIPNLVDSSISFPVCNLNENDFVGKANKLHMRNQEINVPKTRTNFSHQPFKFNKNVNKENKRGRYEKPLFKYKSSKNNELYGEFSRFRPREISPFRMNTCFACNKLANKTAIQHEILSPVLPLEMSHNSNKKFKNYRKKSTSDTTRLSQTELHKFNRSIYIDHEIKGVNFSYEKENHHAKNGINGDSNKSSLFSIWSKFRNSEPIPDKGGKFLNYKIERLSF
ncbi:hypothetical protein FG386_002432 [Cryptosporidium ryanae]|uniref:uncharacterized protein n=1 Tax=Cryptosporidium ryanae TaxID=515981 RepID=UPI00351A6CFF|nr:hypothetical protein FG386_002432 [Cryptosporidium ryanae]